MTNRARLRPGVPPPSPPPGTAKGNAFQPDAAALLGNAIAGVLEQKLPQALAEAIWRVTPPRMCAPCLAAFEAWEEAHRDAITAAVDAAVQQAGGPPRRPDWRPHLPEELRGGVPEVERAVTAVRGTEVCRGHVAGALTA